MIEKIGIPQAPVDKPGADGKEESPEKKQSEKIPMRKIGIYDKIKVRFGSKESQRKLRREKWADLREKERKAHLEGHEMQIPRLNTLTKELGTLKFRDESIVKLAKILYKALNKKRIPKLKSLTEE